MSEPDLSTEFALIDWIRQREQSRASTWTRLGIGDDCAILGIDAGTEILVTTDMLMDGRHFRLAEDGPRAVGYKALGVNLSDIAAMAGVPRAALIAIALPRASAVTVAQGIYQGVRELAGRFGVELVGGDTNAWDGPLVISVTVLGEATARARSGAPGRGRAMRFWSPDHWAVACLPGDTCAHSRELPRPLPCTRSPRSTR